MGEMSDAESGKKERGDDSRSETFAAEGLFRVIMLISRRPCCSTAKGPCSNSGFKTGACQIARSGFEITRFAEIELWPGFEIGEAVP